MNEWDCMLVVLGKQCCDALQRDHFQHGLSALICMSQVPHCQVVPEQDSQVVLGKQCCDALPPDRFQRSPSAMICKSQVLQARWRQSSAVTLYNGIAFCKASLHWSARARSCVARWRRKRTGQSRETQGWEWSCTPMHEMHTWKTSKQELSTRPIFVWPALFGCILNVSGGNITDTQKTEPQRQTCTDRPGQNSSARGAQASKTYSCHNSVHVQVHTKCIFALVLPTHARMHARTHSIWQKACLWKHMRQWVQNISTTSRDYFLGGYPTLHRLMQKASYLGQLVLHSFPGCRARGQSRCHQLWVLEAGGTHCLLGLPFAYQAVRCEEVLGDCALYLKRRL